MIAADAELHVAAMPFPTRQGTQAVVDAMLRARHAAGRSPHLVTYGEGERRARFPYPWHRTVGYRAADSFRSGPSLRKLFLDVALTAKIKRVHRRLWPRAVVAHHVEAAAMCLLADIGPLVFFAHTDLAAELPTYVAESWSRASNHAGRFVDRNLGRRAAAVAAISPMLRDAISEATGRPVHYVPAPWSLPEAIRAEERHTARAELGLDASVHALLYAGNLDAYQGWQDVVRALARFPSRSVLVVATASDPAPLRSASASAGVSERVVIVDLPSDEAGRRGLYAAADLAVVPRRTPGGLPIKLLDSLGRGVPTVAVRRAAAGLPLGSAAVLADDDDPDALAASMRVVLGAPRASAELAAAGREYIRRAHAPARFDAALDSLLSEVTGSRGQTLSRNATRSSRSSELR